MTLMPPSDREPHLSAPAANGRTIVGRLLPGTDLIEGLEAACDHHGVRFAVVLACYGSLASAEFKTLQRSTAGERPSLAMRRIADQVEFMGGQGLVCERPDGSRETHLHGSIADASGQVLGGHFVPGSNPVFNNMDFALQEVQGVRLVRTHDPETDTIEMRVEAAE